MTMDKMKLVAFALGGAAVAGGALLAKINAAAAATLLTAGGWLVGWVMESPMKAAPAKAPADPGVPGSEK